MERTINLMSWQLFLALVFSRQKNIKIPTLEELKRMKREAYRHFKDRLKNLTHYNQNLGGVHAKG